MGIASFLILVLIKGVLYANKMSGQRPSTRGGTICRGVL